jgi:hypothetical protein
MHQLQRRRLRALFAQARLIGSAEMADAVRAADRIAAPFAGQARLVLNLDSINRLRLGAAHEGGDESDELLRIGRQTVLNTAQGRRSRPIERFGGADSAL